MNEIASAMMAPLNELRIDAVTFPHRAGTFSLSLREGRVAAIESAPSSDARWLALPGLVNLHAHADRSFAVQSFRPGSLADALAAATTARAAFTSADVRRRARRFFERSIAHGVTRLRTHTDVDSIVELRSMQGVLAARGELAGRLDVDIIAFSTSRNDLAGPDGVERLTRAIELKPDFLGASLNSSADATRALNALLGLAERNDLPVDLHLDEHLDHARMLAPMVVDAVIARGLLGRVTLGHLCALSTLPTATARALIDKLARGRITVIALPETNLLLQDRADGTPRRRGVTLVRELLAGGVEVRFGTDNVRDWFCPFGDGDMLDTALSGAVTAHLDDQAELIGAICDGRRGIEEGAPADLVLIPASSFDDALARRPAGRMVFKRGRQVAGPALM
jgi:cytosine/creatinine deaminase